jgi:hypothetical protein
MVSATLRVPPHDHPDAPGWSSAATAIHAVGLAEVPMLLVLEARGHGPIVIDFRHTAFAWEVPLDCFPVEPESVGVQTHPVRPGDPALFELPGRNLDALLWMIGLNSFEGALAWWLPADRRYRTTRWPNLTELVHTPQQLRMIAMLGNAFLTPDELAAASGSSPAEAQRLLNALSLMSILRSSATAPAVAPRAEPAIPSRGLFRRLLEKLGAGG